MSLPGDGQTSADECEVLLGFSRIERLKDIISLVSHWLMYYATSIEVRSPTSVPDLLDI